MTSNDILAPWSLSDRGVILAADDQPLFGDHRDFATREAITRVIIAGPDMLALLQELIDIEGPQPGTADWAKKVDAVSAKATGRARQDK